MTRPAAAALAACLALHSACATRALTMPPARRRDYSTGAYAQADPASRPGNGSLFSEAVAGYLEDTRAVRVGDLVVVVIDEQANARGGATTRTLRESSHEMGLTNLMGLIPALRTAYPELDPTQLLAFASRTNFNADGNTARTGALDGNVAVRIVREMPNGDLFLEGTKTVRVNNEQYHLYISGLVRRADITRENTVASSRIADAQVEFSGEGEVADTQRRGWLMRLLDVINPF